MTTTMRIVTSVLTLALLSACATSQRASTTGGDDPNIALLERHVHYANTGDTNAMLAQIAEDFVWYEVAPTGEVVTAVEGIEPLREMLEAYFQADYDAFSTITPPLQSGAYYSTLETVEFSTPDGMARQSAHTVYEIRDGLIRNLWYFPATRMD